ncbi:MAG: hypothetical protein EU542_06880 [Promethearchaeota archaeon]|nr:MAG: hypothetical protein EU542_06880 [Candidatus Lokiarchaeota archaeon]
MRKLFGLSKKGQIQGVDFALAMMIFMIMFAEVLVLSFSFMEPKFQNLNDSAFQTRADQLTKSFFSSSGYPQQWEYQYDDSFNSFGLRETSSNSLDGNKIARINPNALYGLSYQSLRGNISNEGNTNFQFSLNYLIEVNVTLELTQPDASVEITTSSVNCPIWGFYIDPNGIIGIAQKAVTDNQGEYSFTVPIGSGTLPNGHYTLVVFAEKENGHIGIGYDQVIMGSESELGLELLVQENENSNGQMKVQTKNNGGLASLWATIVYPFPGGSPPLSTTENIPTSATEETTLLPSPTNGSCVVLLTGETASGNFERKIAIYPTPLNGNFNTIVGPTNLPNSESVIRIEKIVAIRECVFQAVLYIWEE